MRLVVDGLIFQKDPHGGIARLYREILPRICELAPDLSITVFIDGPLRADLPVHPRLLIKRAPAIKQTLRAKGAWRTAIYPFRRVASRFWNLSRQFWLRRELDAIWHSTYYTMPTAWKGPQVVTVHDMIHEQYPQFFSDPLDEVARRQKRRCIERASAVICVSRATRVQVESFYKLGNVPLRVIPNGYRKDIFRVLGPDAENLSGLPISPFLLYVGGRALYKNFDGLLDAYRQWSYRDEVSLVVVGEPWSKDDRRRLEAAGVAQYVHLLTGVDDKALCQLYNRALAFVFPSLEEGFGIPLLEAMACGCLVVASRIPSTIEVAGDCPFYFDLDRPVSLLAALDQARLAEQNENRIEAGLERVKRFSWDETARQTLDVYWEVWQEATRKLERI